MTGEAEYGYRVMKAGYEGFIHQEAILHHNIRGQTSLHSGDGNRGPRAFTFYKCPAIRCYYISRNAFYFALYDAAEEHFRMWCLAIVIITLKFLVRPLHHRKRISACVRGMWHGLTGNIAARY